MKGEIIQVCELRNIDLNFFTYLQKAAEDYVKDVYPNTIAKIGGGGHDGNMRLFLVQKSVEDTPQNPQLPLL